MCGLFFKFQKSKSFHPEDSASIVSKLLFLWALPLLRLGFKKSLEVNELWEISPKNMAHNIYARFKINLDAEKNSQEKRLLFNCL